MNVIKTDIVIAGGGLAGLGLALQILNTNPKLSIVIVEKNTFPVPETTAKVGESTVELGSHYLTEVLGLKSHFEEKHLTKNGLRCFFGKNDGDFSGYDELGVSELFGIPTYQIERGVLENHLYSLLTEKGVRILDGCIPSDIQLGHKQHKVVCDKPEKQIELHCRWVIDAAGRRALLKTKLGLNKPSEHKGNAVFFRVDKRIVIDQWSDNTSWQQRIKERGKRWLSTNHLMGAGYWIWIIPLGSGATSFGIVMDDQSLNESKITSYETVLQWLQTEQPACARSLADAKVLDFTVIKDYSYDCRQVFSHDGWALTGEASAFADPFYSPGSDFIALNNTFITNLIARDFADKTIQFDCVLFNTFYKSFFENTLSLYKHQYGGFGDRRMMSVKLVWDYTYYWGVFSLLFFTNSMTNIPLMRELNDTLLKTQKLNQKMQKLLQQRAKKRIVLPAKGVFMDQFLVPCLKEVNYALKGQNVDVKATLKSNAELMEKIVPFFEDMLSDSPKHTISEDEQSVLGLYRRSVLA